MNEFYSIRRDDLIRLLADHYELIQSDLVKWKETLKKDVLTYEEIAEFNLEQNVSPLPEKVKRISVIDKNFWLEEWA